MRRSPNFWNRSLELAALAAVVSMIGSGCGGETGGGGDGGGGGGAGPDKEILEGTCADPFDFMERSLEMGSRPIVEGTLEEGQALQGGSCGGEGKELVFHWTPPRDGVARIARITLGSSLTIYLRQTCDDPTTELSCVRAEQMPWVPVVGGERTFVIVDSTSGDPFYDFAIDFRPTNLAEGERCHPDGSMGTCGDGLICHQLEGRCSIAITPTIDDGIAYSHGERFLTRVWARAPSRNIVAMVYRFKDEEGLPVVDEQVVNVKQYAWGKTDFEGGHYFSFANVEGAVSVELQLEDSLGGRSNMIEREIVPAPIRADGEECDPEFFLGTCDEGLVCNAAQRTPRCEPDPEPESESELD